MGLVKNNELCRWSVYWLRGSNSIIMLFKLQIQAKHCCDFFNLFFLQWFIQFKKWENFLKPTYFIQFIRKIQDHLIWRFTRQEGYEKLICPLTKAVTQMWWSKNYKYKSISTKYFKFVVQWHICFICSMSILQHLFTRSINSTGCYII